MPLCVVLCVLLCCVFCCVVCSVVLCVLLCCVTIPHSKAIEKDVAFTKKRPVFKMLGGGQEWLQCLQWLQ